MAQLIEVNGQTIEFPDGMATGDIEAAIKKNFLSIPKAKPAPRSTLKAPDPTEGMGALDKFLAGAGKGVADLGRSVGQGVRYLSPGLADAVGAPTQADIDEAQRLDAPLMATGAGMAGNIGGNIAMALVPGTGQLGAAKKINDLWKAGGAASRLGAVGGAAGMGAAQNAVFNPRGSDDSLGGQLGMGAAMGAAGQVVGPLLADGVQGVRGIKAGSLGTAGKTLSDFAGVDPATLTAMIKAGNRQLVPGSAPTTVQATQNAGLARLKAAMGSMYPNNFAGVDAQQNAARIAALDKIAPGAKGRTAIDAAENAGDILGQEAALHRDTFKGLVRDQYNHPSLDTAAIALPDKGAAMAVLSKFYPGQALGADDQARALAAFAKRLDSGEPIPIKEFDALRKIASNKAADLKDTDRTAAAAWGSLKGLFNDAEGAAIAKSGDKFKVTGQGPWGDQFGNLAGDPENAIAHLLRMGQGSVPGAATHPLAGAIDLAAGLPKGVGGTGVLHVDAHGREESLRRIPQLLTDGTPYGRLEGKNLAPKAGDKGQFFLGDGEFEAVVRNYFNLPNNAGKANVTWSPTAYKIKAGNEIAPEASKGAHRAGAEAGRDIVLPASDAGLMLPDIEAAFKSFDQSLQPPVALRDPRQYVGGLLAPDQAQHLQAGRQLHGELQDRFNTGPASLLTRTGSDGAPRLQGAERIKAFVNSKDSQGADIAQLRKMVLDRGPTMQAAKGYALSDLMQSATDAQGLLSPAKFGNWTDRRSVMLKGLLDTGEQAALSNVNQDLQRAAAADALERVKGQSNTAEKLTSIGLLDSGLTDMAMKVLTRLPVAGGYLGVGLDGSKEAIKRWKYKDLPSALIDLEQALKALRVQKALTQQNMLQRGLLSPLIQQGMVPAVTSGD